MILSSDELDILEYLKSWKGTSVSLAEICRCAGGRKRFKETPHWARPLMARLLDAKLIESNDRGHYRFLNRETMPPAADEDENYFPPIADAGVVGEDYFPSHTYSEDDLGI